MRVMVYCSILVYPPAKPATFSPEKRSLFSIMCALFLPFSPRHGAIITAPLHSKRRSVLSVCAFRRGGALSAGPSPRASGTAPCVVGVRMHHKPLQSPLKASGESKALINHYSAKRKKQTLSLINLILLSPLNKGGFCKSAHVNKLK